LKVVWWFKPIFYGCEKESQKENLRSMVASHVAPYGWRRILKTGC